jgi:hypothetical protein
MMQAPHLAFISPRAKRYLPLSPFISLKQTLKQLTTMAVGYGYSKKTIAIAMSHRFLIFNF